MTNRLRAAWYALRGKPASWVYFRGKGSTFPIEFTVYVDRELVNSGEDHIYALVAADVGDRFFEALQRHADSLR